MIRHAARPALSSVLSASTKTAESPSHLSIVFTSISDFRMISVPKWQAVSLSSSLMNAV